MIPELDGYRYDFVFNHAYHRPLSPTWLRLLTERSAFAFPSSRPLRYLELGYGTGVNLVVHAAAAPGEYWGTDINPAHVRAAKALAQVAGVEPKLLDLSFAQLLEREDLPQFDVIVAHGIWSWVSPGNRAAIVEIVKRHLADGGLFFLSLASLPAEAEIAPLQRILRRQDAANPTDALGLALRLQAAGSPFLAAGSRAGQRLKALTGFSRENLVHDYLNAEREPFLFCDVADALSAAGLRFVASAHLLDRFDDLNFTPDQRAVLSSIEDSALRETAKDFLRPRQHRHDLYIKSGDPVSGDADISFALLAPPFAATDRRISTGLQDVALDDPACMAILDRLAEENCRPKPAAELPRTASVPHALPALIADGMVSPVQPRALASRAIDACARLNAEILRQSASEDTIEVLASPVTGTGIPLSRSQRLLVQAALNGAQTPDALAGFLGQHSPQPTRALLAEVLLFRTYLPCFKALGLVS